VLLKLEEKPTQQLQMGLFVKVTSKDYEPLRNS
jgi:hypothetical protein